MIAIALSSKKYQGRETGGFVDVGISLGKPAVNSEARHAI